MTTGTNEIKAFAYDSGANVLTQTEWAALATTLQNGFSAGILPSKNLNKALRQSSLVAAAVAQFIANKGANVADDGDYAGLATKLNNAIAASVVLDISLGATGYIKLGEPFGNIIIRWTSVTIPALTAYIWDYPDFPNGILFGFVQKKTSDAEVLMINATTSSATLDNYPGSITSDCFAVVVGY